MYTKNSKKLLIFEIMEILKSYSDEDHRLSQKDIEKLLKSEFGVKAERKTIKRNLMNLIEGGAEIEYTERIRRVRDPETGEYEETSILTDFYFVHDFTDAELRLLIDSLVFSKHLPRRQCLELVGKLERLSSRYFHSRVKYVYGMPEDTPQNKQIFLTIETLDEAISLGRQVAFTYNEYHTDKQMHPRLNDEGEVRRYVINPYQIAAANGKYYLICNYDKYDGVSNYRLDRITDIELLDTPVKPYSSLEGRDHDLDLPRHMAEHIYMYTGKSSAVTFRMKKSLVNEVIDWFGCDIEFYEEKEETVCARV